MKSQSFLPPPRQDETENAALGAAFSEGGGDNDAVIACFEQLNIRTSEQLNEEVIWENVTGSRSPMSTPVQLPGESCNSFRKPLLDFTEYIISGNGSSSS
jgi:hypothetical protein